MISILLAFLEMFYGNPSLQLTYAAKYAATNRMV